MIKKVKLNITLSADTWATIKKVTEVTEDGGNDRYFIVDFTIKSDVGTLGSTFTITADELLKEGSFELKEGLAVVISPNGDVQQAISPSKPTNARTPASKSMNLD